MSIHTNLIKYGLHSNKNFTNLNKKIHFNGEQSGGSKKDSKNYFVPAGLFMHGGEKEEEERTDIVKSELYTPRIVAKIEQPAKDKRQTNIEIYLKRPKADISSTIEYKTPEHLNLLYNTKIDASEHRKNENKKRKQEEDKNEKETGDDKGKEKEGEEEKGKEKTTSGGFKLTRKEKGKIKLRKTRKKKHRKNKQIKKLIRFKI